MERFILDDMPIERYHAHPHYSKTDIVRGQRSTQYPEDMRLNPPDPTPAMALGTAVHKAVLEGGMVGGEIMVCPAGVRRGKVYEAFVKENPGKIILLEKELEDFGPMVDSVFNHPMARRMLKQGKPEVSFFTELEADEYKLPVKCRPDWLPGALQVVDLKTARDVTPEGFGKAGYSFHYHWSAWITCEIIERITGEQHTYYFLTVENHYPHETVIYQVRPLEYWIAGQEVWPVIEQLAKAHTTGKRQEIAPNNIIDFQLPAWVKRRFDYAA